MSKNLIKIQLKTLDYKLCSEREDVYELFPMNNDFVISICKSYYVLTVTVWSLYIITPLSFNYVICIFNV